MAFKYRDLCLALFCAFLGSVKGYLVSQVKFFGAIGIFGLRAIGAACFILPIILYSSYKIWYSTKKNIILLLRSIVGNIAVCGYYYGFVHLPIAEASLLFYSTPIFTIIIGHLFLKERCRFTEVFAIIISICGVCTICVPQFSLNYSISTVIGVVGCLVGALTQAIALVLIRKITEIPPFIVSFWWAAVGILFSAALSGTFKEMQKWNCGWEAMCIVFIAVVGFLSEVCLVSALKSTDAVIVSLALTSEIIWAFLLQFLAYKEIPSLTTVLGGVLICISLFLAPIVSLTCRNMYKVDEETVSKNCMNW